MSIAPRFELVAGWEQLPPGFTHLDVSGLGVDSGDRVYVLTRQQARVIVYAPDGRFLRTFGEGLFTERTHGLTVGPGDSVYCVDDGNHTVRKFTPDGELLMTLGISGVASDTGFNPALGPMVDRQHSIVRSGPPFNKPTNLAVAPWGDLYVSDGYGNARVHRFTADGRLVNSWGEPGNGPGQFHLPHGILVTSDGCVLVADRENDRVQVFDAAGAFQAEWTQIQRPTHLCQDARGLIYVAELAWLPGDFSFRRGARDHFEPGRVSILTSTGEVLGRLGKPIPAEDGGFYAPHAICLDSRGDLYVGEVTWTFTHGGTAFPLADGFHTLQKFARQA